MFVFNNNHFAEDRFLHSLIFFRRLLPAVHKEKQCLGRLKKYFRNDNFKEAKLSRLTLKLELTYFSEKVKDRKISMFVS